jgi:integrase
MAHKVTTGRRHFGNVRKLPSGRWQASYWHDGYRHIGAHTFHQKADAYAFLDSVAASIHRGDWVNPEFGRIAFKDYATMWLAQRTDIRPRTREYYGWLITNRLVPHFGNRELSKITPVHIRGWYAGLATETPGVAHSAYRVLRAIFNTAILDELIVKNPCRIKGGGTDKSAERKIPTVQQVAALTEAMPEQYRAAVIFAAWGTLRRGEVLGLMRKDIDLVAGTVRVERALHEYHDGSLELGPTKNGDPRRIYLPRSVMPEVEHHLQRFVGPREDSPLFVGATGEPLRPSGLWNIWEHSRRKARLETVRFHDLRHFAATMFASTGASTKEIMSRGGWKSVAMVVRYEHASEERDALLAQALDAVAMDGIITPLRTKPGRDRARSAHETDVVEGELLPLPPLTSPSEHESSGGETRTLNLAVNSRLLCR